MLYWQILATVVVVVIVVLTHRLSGRLMGRPLLPGLRDADDTLGGETTCEITCKDGTTFSATCKTEEAGRCMDALGTICTLQGGHPLDPEHK
jgi:hypothetical protein